MSATARDVQNQMVRIPKRWPLVQQPSNREDDYFKDARLVNAFAEQDPETGEWWVQKRIGYALNYNTVVNGLGRGMYTWFHTPSLAPVPEAYAVVGNGSTANIYKNGVVVSGGSFNDSAGNWSFTETQPPSSSGTRYLIFTAPNANSGLYYTNGTTWNQATLPAGRGSFIAGVCYLDGTIYFMDEFCNIWGSNINDPTTWSALNNIAAQSIPGIGVCLVKQLTYVIALKTASMEVFFDNANATGSPLNGVPGAVNDYGCADRNTVQVLDGILFYITMNRSGAPQVVRVDNLAPTIISTSAVDRLISAWIQTGTTYSFAFKFGGHRYYGISNNAISGVGITMVYDIDQKLWYQWTNTPAGSPFNPLFFPMCGTALGTGGLSQFLHPTNGNVYTFGGDYDFPTDNGNIATVDIYTPTTDFGTRRLKTLHRMYLNTDIQPGSVLQVRHSDDDFQHWSNFRTRDLSKKDPYLDDEGTFIRRAYHFRHAAASKFRIRSADLQMDIGTI